MEPGHLDNMVAKSPLELDSSSSLQRERERERGRGVGGVLGKDIRIHSGYI